MAHTAGEWISGRVVAGHGVASGRATDSPYPDGTIKLQAPHFLARGVDLSGFYAGTLNVDLAPLTSVPHHAVFDVSLDWFGKITERFLLAPVVLQVGDRCYEGLWYYPHPATKPAHFQRASVVELLLPWVDGLSPGTPVMVKLLKPADGAV